VAVVDVAHVFDLGIEHEVANFEANGDMVGVVEDGPGGEDLELDQVKGESGRFELHLLLDLNAGFLGQHLQDRVAGEDLESRGVEDDVER
jgi:hypothetical protein